MIFSRAAAVALLSLLQLRSVVSSAPPPPVAQQQQQQEQEQEQQQQQGQGRQLRGAGEQAEVAAAPLPGPGRRASSKATAKVALALAGGGFRAFSTDVGLIAGLLAVSIKRQGNGSTALSASDILKRFDTISTTSGSSWFFSQLAYSPGFLSLVEAMGAAPQRAGVEFNGRWMSKWVAVGHRDGKDTDDFSESVESSGAKFLQQDLKELAYFWKRGLSWNDFTSELLQTTGGLDSRTLLGSPTAEALRGKAWLACHSVVAGTEQRRALLSSSFSQSVHYRVPADSAFRDKAPVYLPAKISVTLGDGTDSRAPFPYMATSPASTRPIQYTGSTLFGLWRITEESPSLGELGAAAFQEAGSLPVVGVVAASSAFLGGICLNPVLAAAAGMLKSEFTPWAALARGGADSFKAGVALSRDLSENGVSRSRLASAANAGVAGLIDGAYTDNTGIAHAVGAGAEEVTAVLTEIEALYSLFQNGHATRVQVGVPRLHMPIFAESLTQSMFQNLTDLRPAHDRGHLERLMTGTVKATTAANEWFGIGEGRQITIHLVYIRTGLKIGGLDAYKDYTKFVQEIVDCLTLEENAQAVDQSLLTRF